MLDDPYRIKRACEKAGIKLSGLSAHTPLCKPVGCACGDGVIDWKQVVEICEELPRDIVFSVECGTMEQAERSISYLKKLV